MLHIYIYIYIYIYDISSLRVNNEQQETKLQAEFQQLIRNAVKGKTKHILVHRNGIGDIRKELR